MASEEYEATHLLTLEPDATTENIKALRDYVAEDKGGWLRKPEALDLRLQYTAKHIHTPMCANLLPEERKAALKCSRKLMLALGLRHKGIMVMDHGDAAPISVPDCDAVSRVIGIAMEGNEALRDEVYLQISRQLTGAPDIISERMAWQVLGAVSNFLRPSKELLHSMTSTVTAQMALFGKPPVLPIFEGRESADVPTFVSEREHIHVIATCTKLRLRRLADSDLVLRVPGHLDIAESLRNPYRQILFGISLEELYAAGGVSVAEDADPATLTLPRIVTFLTEAVLKLGGTRVHGICRVPGLDDEVQMLRARLDRGYYSLEGITDASTAASLFSRWLTQIPHSLFPAYMYEQCVAAPEQLDPRRAVTEAIDALPPVNRAILRVLVRLIRTLGQPQHARHTQMPTTSLAITFGPNILRTPMDRKITPQQALEITNREKRFVTIVVAEMADCPLIVPKIDSVTT